MSYITGTQSAVPLNPDGAILQEEALLIKEQLVKQELKGFNTSNEIF